MGIYSKKRRQLLQMSAGSVGLLTLGPFAQATSASKPALVANNITDRLVQISGAGGNSMLFRGDHSVSVIDSGSPEHTADLLMLILELAGTKAVATLFNTHWHPEHTGGNEAFHELGADIIAHVNTGLWLAADFDVEWRQWSHSPRPPQALPDITFYTSGERDLGGEQVQYHHFPRAHTDGDIALYFPDSNVLVAGGLLSDGSYPITDIATGGWIGGLLEANAAMLQLIDDKTILIPQRGPARDKAALQAQHDMLADLYEQMKELARQGYSGHDMLDAGVTSAYDPDWGDPEEFVLETYRGMWAHTYDMGGFI